jgi:hypothetical protein
MVYKTINDGEKNEIPVTIAYWMAEIFGKPGRLEHDIVQVNLFRVVYSTIVLLKLQLFTL